MPVPWIFPFTQLPSYTLPSAYLARPSPEILSRSHWPSYEPPSAYVYTPVPCRWPCSQSPAYFSPFEYTILPLPWNLPSDEMEPSYCIVVVGASAATMAAIYCWWFVALLPSKRCERFDEAAGALDC